MIPFLVCHEVALSHQLEEFWKVESYGADNYEAKSLSVEDRKAEKIIENTITKVDGHYQMDLLWRHNEPSLPYNRVVVEARQQHLKKRFRRGTELGAKYRAVIENYLAKGYARKMTSTEASERTDTTWYLPHHPVLNPNKPGKVRVVFDAAATVKGTSLNEQLLRGPDLTNNLAGILIRFREEGVAFTADIKAMFYQTIVTPKDTDALRSVPTTEQAIILVDLLMKLLKEGGLRLTKIICNFREVLASIPAEELANPSINLDHDQLPTERALGLHWDSQTDTFQFKVVTTNKPPTKRGIMSAFSSLYDPLGFLSPFVLPVKVFLQELWRQEVHWAYFCAAVSSSQQFARDIYKVGLVINPSLRHLGCSPDRRVYDATATPQWGLLEIKCSMAGLSDLQYLKFNERTGTYSLRKTHAYFYQVMGCLGLTGSGWVIFLFIVDRSVTQK